MSILTLNRTSRQSAYRSGFSTDNELQYCNAPWSVSVEECVHCDGNIITPGIYTVTDKDVRCYRLENGEVLFFNQEEKVVDCVYTPT